MRDTQRIRPLTPADARMIDQACDRFEAAWKAGPPPRVEEFLAGEAGSCQQALLRQLLLLDWEYRRRNGSNPLPEEYQQRFPGEASVIAEVCREMVEPPSQSRLSLDNASDERTPWSGSLEAETWLPTACPPASDSRYQLLHEVGHGGIGVVFRGRDRLLGREVAVKVLHAAHQGKHETRRRFIEEARVGSRLQHPAIVPVYEMGAFEDERPFFTMKLVEGRTLAALLRNRPDPKHDLSRWLGVFGQVCQAMDYAHVQGIVHRDLKPGNIMVGLFGEVQVMDWGFAKQLLGAKSWDDAAVDEADSTLTEDEDSSPRRSPETTRSGVVMGTPSYMPPEQARGEIHRIDPRADVFALGAILCEILTGKPPYQGANAEEICRKAVQGDLRDPFARLDACGADADLCDLAKRCLAADYRERLPDAGIVMRNFSAYLSSAQERLRQAQLARAAAEARVDEAVAKVKAERHARRLTLALAAAVVVFLVLGGVGWWWRQHVYQAEEARQATADTKAEAALAEAVHALERGDWQQARVAAFRARDLLESGGNPRRKQQGEELLADLELAARIDENRRLQGVYDFASAGFTREKALPHYKEAFERYDVAIGTDPAQVAARLAQRPGPIREAILAGLDNWWMIAASRDTATYQWLDSVLKQVDADVWRTQVRQAIHQRDRNRLVELARRPEVKHQPPSAITLLAASLIECKFFEEAITFLRPAQQRHPADFWINLDLAHALMLREPPDYAEALRYYLVVRAVRPEASVHLNLSFLFSKQQDWDGVIIAARKALELTPEKEHLYRAQAYTNLGNGLANKGDYAGARVAYTQAMMLDSALPQPQTGLGFLFFCDREIDHSIAAYEHALKLSEQVGQAGKDRQGTGLSRDDLVTVHLALGNSWAAKKNVPQALAAFEQVIRLNPKFARAYCNRGHMLILSKRYDEALAAYEHAARLDPAMEDAHRGQGSCWQLKGCPERAIAPFLRTIELNDKSVEGHHNLGLIFYGRGERDKAIIHYRKALQIKPDLAPAHCGLADALLKQGALAEALAHLVEANKFGAAYSDVSAHTAQWVKQVERLIAVEAKLPGILSGEDKPASAYEELELAVVCDLKGLHRTSARLFASAFQSRPALATTMKLGYRYQAACVAAKASCSPTHFPWDAVDRSHWRRQALDWLRADMAQMARGLEQSPDTRKSVRDTLQRWQKEKVLACLREPEALAKLPASDRAECLKFWAEVQEVVVRSLVTTGMP
jgi:eukaryotic-like serine/threonine-protein kinase